MATLSNKSMLTLFTNAGKTSELIFDSENSKFKIDLNKENLELWYETYSKFNQPCNLLLACENNKVELMSTKLTWVVGSAIRPANPQGALEVRNLLYSLGISEGLLETVQANCPGIGQDFIWAFYLERHGWLASSPILDDIQRDFFLTRSF